MTPKEILSALRELGVEVGIQQETIEDEWGKAVGIRATEFIVVEDWENPFSNRRVSFAVGERYLRLLQRRRDRAIAASNDALASAWLELSA